MLEAQRNLELQRQASLLEQQRKTDEEQQRLRQLQQQQNDQLKYNEMIDSLRNQNARDRETIDAYERVIIMSGYYPS